MSDELVERLRSMSATLDLVPDENLVLAAADRIDELERRNQQWGADNHELYNRMDGYRTKVEELEAALRDAEATIEAMNGDWIAPRQALGDNDE